MSVLSSSSGSSRTCGRRCGGEADCHCHESTQILPRAACRASHLSSTPAAWPTAHDERPTKSPALYWPPSEFAIGTLESVMSEVNHLHENEIGQLQSRASALEMQLRHKLAMAKENAVGCGDDYQNEFTNAQKGVMRARERLHASKMKTARAKERLRVVRGRTAEQLK